MYANAIIGSDAPIPYAVIPWLIVRHEREVAAATGRAEAPSEQA